MEGKSREEVKTFIQKCKETEKTARELMKLAARTAGRNHYNNAFPFSPKLEKAAENLKEAKSTLSIIKTQ